MRYLPLTDENRADMLAAIGVANANDLFFDVPENARNNAPISGLPMAAGELAVERHLSALSAKNIAASNVPFFCGAGAYKHHVPATVDHIIQRSEFLTTYTPYQPEIAQGTLQTMFEFQTQVAELLGMDVANASMYDGSTACAEAVVMAHRVNKRTKLVFSGGVHPHYIGASRLLADGLGLKIIAQDVAPNNEAGVLADLDADTACVVVAYPNVFGTISDLTDIASIAHEKGALMIVVFTEVMAFGLIEPPGAMGADIVVGEGQSIGNGLNFGGPYVGLFATRQNLVRQMPGRLTGETVDSDGNRGFVLTLSTREQHIRRDKATSNICTNSGLCALAFTAHLTLLGQKGLSALASQNHAQAQKAAAAIAKVDGVTLLTSQFFNEFAITLPTKAVDVVEALAAQHILGGVPFSRLDPNPAHENILLVAVTEVVTDEDIAQWANAISTILAQTLEGASS